MQPQRHWGPGNAPLDQPGFSPLPVFSLKPLVPSDTSHGQGPAPNPSMVAGGPKQRGETALSAFLCGCRRGFSSRRDGGQLGTFSLEQNKEGELRFGGKIKCDGKAAHTPSAPTGQLEENLYKLMNTKATDGVGTSPPPPSHPAVLEQSSSSAQDAGHWQGTGWTGEQHI